MSGRLESLSKAESRKFANCPVNCPRLRQRVATLADYFSVVSSVVSSDDTFWFRGHARVNWSLTPSALRYSKSENRKTALELMSEFKRIADMKLRRPPSPNDELMWTQIAQHYGLPTRLLDWTESATTALYFSCLQSGSDGIVFIINPVELNRLSSPARPRILDPQRDKVLILKYLSLGSRESRAGAYPLAINPIWNSERLVYQKGVFTLHGSRFSLDEGPLPSLVALPILSEFKQKLRKDLQRIGVDEMTLFPELEHSCAHLKRRSGLEGLD